MTHWPNSWFGHRLRAGALLLSLMSGLGICSATSVKVAYQGPEDLADVRRQYDWIVLRAALERTRKQYGDFELGPGGMLSHADQLGEMINPAGKINVLSRGTTIELERALLPIRIPIDRGVLGYRVLMVRHSDVDRFRTVRQLADLRQFTFLQAPSWVDARILSASDLTVMLGPYDILFGELIKGAGDAFPRSIAEAVLEFEQRHARYPDLDIEPRLMLRYPFARYFFVRRDREGKRLAKRIEQGLEMMIADGSLLELFDRHVLPLLARLHVDNRQIIDMPNPFLPALTPLSRKELWYGQVGGGRARRAEH